VKFDPIEPPPYLTRRQEDIWKSSSRAVTVEFKWHEICVSIRCEVHSEYFTITTFAELEKARLAAAEKDRDLRYSSFDTFDKNINDARAYFRGDFLGDKKVVEDAINQYFFMISGIRILATFQHIKLWQLLAKIVYTTGFLLIFVR
jgi:hypothetical protein